MVHLHIRHKDSIGIGKHIVVDCGSDCIVDRPRDIFINGVDSHEHGLPLRKASSLLNTIWIFKGFLVTLIV